MIDEDQNKPIELSAEQAVYEGADALVVTHYTGIAPVLEKVRRVKNHVGDFPVLVGSGVTPENAPELLSIADGAIVGTYFQKTGKIGNGIDLEKVKDFMDTIRTLRSSARGSP